MGPAEAKASRTGPAEAKVSRTGPAEAKVSWTGPTLGGALEALTLVGTRVVLSLWGAREAQQASLGGALEALTLVGARAALTLVGALESWTEPAATKMSWAGPAEELESTCEEKAPEGAGEEQAPEGAGEEQAPEGAGEEQVPEGAGEEQAPEGVGEEQALGLGSNPSPHSPLTSPGVPGGARVARNWTEPAETKTSWAGPAKMSWAGPAETKMSWMEPTEMKESLPSRVGVGSSWRGMQRFSA